MIPDLDRLLLLLMTKSLIDHLESHLGVILEGWNRNPDGVEIPFQIIRLSGPPQPSGNYYCTLGLSNFALVSPEKHKEIRCEFLICSRCPENLIASILQRVGLKLLESRRAILRGELIGHKGALLPESKMTALYATIPIYLPDSVAAVSIPGLGAVVLIWLVPVTNHEAEYVERQGWLRFEEALEEKNPDLYDWSRPSIF